MFADEFKATELRRRKEKGDAEENRESINIELRPSNLSARNSNLTSRPSRINKEGRQHGASQAKGAMTARARGNLDHQVASFLDNYKNLQRMAQGKLKEDEDEGGGASTRRALKVPLIAEFDQLQ